MINPSSDMKNVDPEFLKNKYTVRLSGNFNQSFINDFVEKFKDVKNLDLSTQYGVSNSFVYSLTNLEGLVIPLFKDDDFVLDGSRLSKKIYSLHISTYSKKKIINIDAFNQTDLEHLTISDFTEKDLSLLSDLHNLKSLSFLTARIKSLKGIENMSGLKVLSLGGVKNLIDISHLSWLQNLKYLEFNICGKLQDFSIIQELNDLEVLKLNDCKNLASIKFVKNLMKLRELHTLGTTLIHDYDTTPAQDVPIYFGSRSNEKYNVSYPEKESKEGQKTASSFL